MPFHQIILILSSGFGVLFGIFLAVFLWSYPKGNSVANKILCILILILSFRVGKSVFMELGDGIDLRLIFIGLGTQLTLGPLFYVYTQLLIKPGYKIQVRYFYHFLPFIPALIFGFWITPLLVKQLPTSFFVLLFIIYYGHYFMYLMLSLQQILKAKHTTQKIEIINWLKTLLVALLIIWLIYVLNLFEDLVPYIIGPISYSTLIFIVAIIALKNDYIAKVGTVKYKTTAIEVGEATLLYQKVLTLVYDQKQYKNHNVSLKSLSADLKTSPQKLSMAINANYNNNFNAFINSYRIAAAKELLLDPHFEQYTIAAIAYEVGFNSLSSFNDVFKKTTKLTPVDFKANSKMTISST
ncbi:MAG: helix-turn-helix domain-containing protein [Bacteroidota bacterium]